MSRLPGAPLDCSACLSEPAIAGGLGAGCLARIAHDAKLRAICWSCRLNIPTKPGGSCEECQRASNARALRNAHATLDADDGPLTDSDFYDPTPDEYYFAPGIRNERRALGGRRGGE